MDMRDRLLTAVFLLSPLVAGCSGSAVEAKTAADGSSAAAPVQRLERMTVVGYRADDLIVELERARALLLVDRFEPAANAFDKLMRLTTDPELKALATYNSGVAYEGLGKREMAATRYGALASDQPDEPITRNALVRLSRLQGYGEHWKELGETADQLLNRSDLPEMDRIEAYGARALSLLERGELQKAKLAVARAQAIIEKHSFGRSGAPPVQLAQVSFAEGEIRRLDSEKLKLTPVPTNFAEVLEARCQGLLDAQSAYTEAMRSRDAHWSAMSGYRIGQLYQQLHRETMLIPPPKNTSLKKKQLFEAAMRLRYRILIEKGLKMMDGIVRLAKRTGEDSDWITRARNAKTALAQSLADEKAALKKTPYSEEEIRAALDRLKSMAKPKP
jgi:tetratricopeptide (TPR) repeat protein